ncbi:MAG: hypothetical protein AAGI53_07665 [Planctomycetota bacterium]
MPRAHFPSILVAALAATASAQLDNATFYLIQGDGKLFSGQFGTRHGSLVGDTGLRNASGFLDFDASGNLYGSGFLSLTPGDYGFVKINPTNAGTSGSVSMNSVAPAFGLAMQDDRTAIVVGQTAAPGPQVIQRYDVVTGELLSSVDMQSGTRSRFGWELRSDGKIITASNNTGEFQIIDPITGAVSSLGAAPGRIYGWTTYGGATFFGMRDTDLGSPYSVYTIDPYTGSYAFVADLGGEFQADIDTIFGFAFLPDGGTLIAGDLPPLPSPGTLLAVSALGLVVGRRRRFGMPTEQHA